jgi:hypothetical protein
MLSCSSSTVTIHTELKGFPLGKGAGVIRREIVKESKRYSEMEDELTNVQLHYLSPERINEEADEVIKEELVEM